MGNLGAVTGDGIEQHLFMVAPQVDRVTAQTLRASCQQVDDAGRVRAAVDVVADVEQQRSRHRVRREIGRHEPVKILEAPCATVHVADRVDTAAGCDPAWCSLP